MTTGNQRATSLTQAQRLQIGDWLKEADKMIREARYLVADEFLQKILEVHPENEIALTYQDRIQFLIKQLSQRVGLNSEVQSEIRKFRDLTLKRNKNQISTLLVSAQKFLDDGYMRKAGEAASKALALDPENMYAKLFMQRIAELRQTVGFTQEESDAELRVRAVMKEAWQEGDPSESQIAAIRQLQEAHKISAADILRIERDVRNILYREALHRIWLTGGLAAFTNESIDALRGKFRVSRFDHSFIESSLLNQVRKNRVKGTILVVDEDENTLLELTARLRENAYAVIAAGSYKEALESLKIITPDAVLSETTFSSGLGGFDLFEVMRLSPSTKYTLFIFITAVMDRTTQLIGKRLGVDEYLEKPVDIELLLATIRGKLARRIGKPKSTDDPSSHFPFRK